MVYSRPGKTVAVVDVAHGVQIPAQVAKGYRAMDERRAIKALLHP